GYFGYYAAKIHPDVRVLDQGGTLLTDRLEQARAAGATGMLAVVLPRYSREALDALRDDRTAGLSVVVLTDSPVSPAAEFADAERPDDLVVYGGTGKAARDWPSFHALVRTLSTLDDDETMLVQSGRPVGVFRTHEWAPRVLIANSNLVPDWATWPEFRRLEQLGLTMYGQMTAGSWIYIGTQGILQGTYETFAAVAAKRFGGTLAGTLTLTAGCGGMGGAQPLAVTMNGGACLIVDVDAARLHRRVATRYLDLVSPDLDSALELALEAVAERRALSVGVVGNAATVVPELL